MNALAGGVPGADAMKEKAKQEIEKQLGDKAPGSIKPLFPLCGGPVATMEKCICAVPADQQDDVKAAIEKYKGL